jgi:hypothetical protein
MANGITLENPGFVRMYEATAKVISELIPFEKFTDFISTERSSNVN